MLVGGQWGHCLTCVEGSVTSHAEVSMWLHLSHVGVIFLFKNKMTGRVLSNLAFLSSVVEATVKSAYSKENKG
jgi:hypothetical protein